MFLTQKMRNLNERKNRKRIKEITQLIWLQRHISAFRSCGSSMFEKIWKRDPPLRKVQSWVSTLLSHSHTTLALMSDKTQPLFLV